ncbi:hypothetical protein MPTK1_1g11760 [Marchantia polymorpha subsp. ruderalis]|uniref:Uncharacterized protein n=2 Tax=Marchantia polymorpha TaxID=3197 RepID=A0AAF6AP43_MARPO|nr:hypothetical protein MARPO_0014s0051 [Marchantia polymorpha]BBM98213.1 hypothetical protein Mp_1g11760 [Marchantia polymorpha subsp. ruderalis]|eukprot:PTQ45507.1 hypothetical protein MARPO_0014s0051 [Marchantia polymorpha]
MSDTAVEQDYGTPRSQAVKSTLLSWNQPADLPNSCIEEIFPPTHPHGAVTGNRQRCNVTFSQRHEIRALDSLQMSVRRNTRDPQSCRMDQISAHDR